MELSVQAVPDQVILVFQDHDGFLEVALSTADIEQVVHKLQQQSVLAKAMAMFPMTLRQIIAREGVCT
jgi:hypothetical protein